MKYLFLLFVLSMPAYAVETVAGLRLPGWEAIDWHAVPYGDTIIMAPKGQTKDNWRESISIKQINLAVREKPEEILATILDQDLAKLCNWSRRGPISPGVDNHFPTATVAYVCGKSNVSGQGAMIVLKVLAGKTVVVYAQRVVRGPPFDADKPELMSTEKMNELQQWASGVFMCDQTSPCSTKGE